MDLFERIFGSDQDEGEQLLEARDRLLALFIYDVACEVFQPDNSNTPEGSNDEPDSNEDSDTASIESFVQKVEATRENFERIVRLFKQTRNGRKDFLKNFQKWAPICKKHMKLLTEIAEAIHGDKFNSDIARLVGFVISTAGSIACALSYITPLAVVTVPLTVGGGIACGLGAATVLGTSGTEIYLLKKNLEEAKKTIKEHEKKFSLMAHWFTMPEELKKTFESVVSFDVLKEISEDMKKFFAEVSRETKLTIGGFKIRFREVLKLCMGKISASGNVASEFGAVFTPIVITFIFLVCVVKSKNRIILDCIMITGNLALSLSSILNFSVPAGKVARTLFKDTAEYGDDIFKLSFMKVLVGLNLLIDTLSLVLTSIEIHKRPEPIQTKKIKEGAEQLEKMFLAIENVYNEIKRLENTASGESTTIIVNYVPDDAGQEDIRIAIRRYLPDSVWDCIKLERLKTNGNNWYVEVPTSDAEQLLLQSHLIIKGKRCVVTQ